MKKRIIDFDELWDYLGIKIKELEKEYEACDFDDFYNKQKILDQQELIIDLKFRILKANHNVEIKEKEN